MKDIELRLDSDDIKSYSEIKGFVVVHYRGKYDGVVINTQIIGSNNLIVYISFN